jgi:hypothetical protein
MQIKSANSKEIIQNIIVWLGSAFFLFWFWDKWMLDGPHGTYRWVGMDFVPFWVGVQEMLKGLNPYTPEVTLKIQEAIYGGPAGAYDPMMFVYPAWIFLVFIPFSLLPLPWAVIIYGSTLILILFNILKDISNLWAGPDVKAKIFWLIVLGIGSLPFLIISAMKGQLGYVGLIALYICRRFWNKKPFWAGIVLGFAVIKPTVTVIPVAGFLLWALFEKKWKVLIGFSGLLFLLSMASFFASGFWIPEYLQMLTITGGMPVLWSQQILTPPWNFIYFGYFSAILLYGLINSIKSRHPYPWFSATILAGIALFPMRWIYDLFLGILVPANDKRQSNLARFSLAFAILFPWSLVFVGENNRWEFATIAIPIIWSFVFVAQNLVKEHPGNLFWRPKQSTGDDENTV